MIGGGSGDWFDIVLFILAAGCTWPSELLSKIGIAYWKQNKKMERMAQVIAFIAYFLFATIIHHSLDEPYFRLMMPIVYFIVIKEIISSVSAVFGYDDDSPC